MEPDQYFLICTKAATWNPANDTQFVVGPFPTAQSANDFAEKNDIDCPGATVVKGYKPVDI